MMNTRILMLHIGIILFCCLSDLCGQDLADSLKNIKVETKDGNTFIGYLVSEDSVSLTLQTGSYGKISFDKANIKSWSSLPETKKVSGRLWLPETQSSRYFWAPNGYGFERGVSQYQNVWVLFNQISLGLTNHFSMDAGVLPLFFFGGSPTPFWIIPKFSIPVVKDKFNIGAGALIGTVVMGDVGIFGKLFGVVTFGSRDTNCSLGLAWAFSDDRPIINISAVVRTGPHGYLITENYFIPEYNKYTGFLSLGGRSIVRTVGIDYCLAFPVNKNIGTFFAIPLLGISVPFGKTIKNAGGTSR